MTGVGFLVGFHVHTNGAKLVAAMLLVLLFGYALAWVFATVGLLLRNPESAQAAAFPIMAPLVFASSAFVPIQTMPGWLQAFAKVQPVSVTVDAVRALTQGQAATATLGHGAGFYVVRSLVWAAGIVAVFAPLAVARFRRG
jgi:ABC-2 type transport system permease protein/oleandomycin transport system permease protein